MADPAVTPYDLSVTTPECLTMKVVIIILAVFFIAIGAVLVRNSVTLSIEERRRQTAIVAALGGSPRTLVGGTLIEAGLLGLVGGALGALGGVVVAHPIAASLSDFTVKIAGNESEPGKYEVGAQVTVTATPSSDSVFQSWTVNGTVVSTAPSYTFTVSTDQVLTANFQ